MPPSRKKPNNPLTRNAARDKQPRRNSPYGQASAPPPAKEPSPARRVALEMLFAAEGRNVRGMETVLDDARRDGTINGLDAGLAQEIALGVSRQRMWLEKVLGQFLHHPLPKQANKVGTALLMGIYQALFLDRIPPHTVVDETVRLVGTLRTETSYRALANAVMRRVVEAPRETLLPQETDPWMVRHSVPSWLASEAGQVFTGGSLKEFFAASNQPAPLNLRIVARPGVPPPNIVAERVRGEIVDVTNSVPEVAQGEWMRDSLIVRARGLMPAYLPSFLSGIITAEDEGAQIAGALTGAKEGMRILDLCASPGGKAAHMADLANRKPRKFIATDVDEEKLHRLRETLQRLGLQDIVEVKLERDLNDAGLAASFDLVLVDAPCSSLGTIRRHPEVRWRNKVSTIKSLAKVQGKILDRAAGFVALGGILTYSVCTFTRQETDMVVSKFLSEHADFTYAPAPKNLDFNEKAFRAGEGRWRTSPHMHGTDAFYVARMRRRE